MTFPYVHPDTPYWSSGSYGGWRKCRTCMQRNIRGDYVPPNIRAQVSSWHERIYADMFEDYFQVKQEQPNVTGNTVSTDTGPKV